MEKRNLPPDPADLSDEAIGSLWEAVLGEARLAAANPYVGAYIGDLLLSRGSMDGTLAYLLAESLGEEASVRATHRLAFQAIIGRHPSIRREVVEDLGAYYRKDPACRAMHHVLLYYKGFQALLCHRIAHAFWAEGEVEFARYLNHAASCRFAVDIHPGAVIAGGVFLDHGTGIVIGETAVVKRNVSILQGVTLGGTGKETKDRHPKIAEGVLIGAGAKLLGNIKVGEGAKVGAGTVLLHDLPPHVTAVGIPGRIVGQPKDAAPGDSMDQDIGEG